MKENGKTTNISITKHRVDLQRRKTPVKKFCAHM